MLVDLDEIVDRSAAPAHVRTTIARLQTQGIDVDHVAEPLVAVLGASRVLATAVVADPSLLEVLTDLDRRLPLDASSRAALTRWKRAEELRIAARDLTRRDDLPATVALVSAMAIDVVRGACALAETTELAVIGMGKLGGGELNYASDIDVVFASFGDPSAAVREARQVLEHVRPSFRVDVNLRPQGRDGALVRSLQSYEAYWERWAEPWEFQALLKARAIAGDAPTCAAFDASAAEHLWDRSFTADDLAALRALKARTEAEIARSGTSDREIKRGRGGIRDIEFAVQLLQLVHGRLDPDLRDPSTLGALAALARGGYIDDDDAAVLGEAYVVLRALEHRLQLLDGQQVYALPVDPHERDRLARTMGLRDEPASTALEQLDALLGRHQATVRSVHERLYFRPLLEAFLGASADTLARPGALEARLSAFGFSDTLRTKAAVRELTKGLSRSSMLMQQMLPLLLGWLAESPDPDLGLLSLRNLSSGHGGSELARTFRDSPEAARRLCLLLGTSRIVGDAVRDNVDIVGRLADPDRLRTATRAELVAKAHAAIEWRDDLPSRQAGLRRWKERNLLGIVARDVLEGSPVDEVGADLTHLAEAAIEVALAAIEPKLAFAVVALGRFGGCELSYASDLDVVFVYDGSGAADVAEAERVATALRRFVQGTTPATRLWALDADLRPEGKQGPLARSLDGYATYFSRWAETWERQAMARARPVAGDAEVQRRFMHLLDDAVWDRGVSHDDVRAIRRMKARIERERIPAGDDPQYHLKLGRGSLSDVEWTAQLLQLVAGIREPGTMAGLGRLVEAGIVHPSDAIVLGEAYRFCERTRNRWFLVHGAPSDSLPTDLVRLRWLARSLGTDPTTMRESYRRVTRRARGVMERLFYGSATP